MENSTTTTSRINLFKICNIIILSTLILAFILMLSKSTNKAKLLVIANEYNAFNRAVTSFKNFYGTYPGDFAKATHIFKHKCLNHICDGNGNNLVDNENESYLVAKHLSLAKLLNGTYSGNANSPDYAQKYIASFFRNGYYSPMIHSSVNYSAKYNGSLNNRHFIVYGMQDEPQKPYKAILTPQEAQYLDNKIDDGHPLAGLVQIRPHEAPKCANNSDYDVNINKPACNLLFYIN